MNVYGLKGYLSRRNSLSFALQELIFYKTGAYLCQNR